MDARRLQIDSLRGLACLALVTFHTIGSDRNAGLRVDDQHFVRLLSDLLGYLRMPLFAFISGYVYALRPVAGDAPAFIAAKVRRLLVPMLAVGTLFAIVQANTPGTNFQRYDWALLHIRPVAHYWFLESLFLVFLVVVAIERQRWLAARARFVAVWLAAAVLFEIDPLPSTLGLGGAAYLLPFVLLGIGCRRFAVDIRDRRVIAAAAALLCGLAFAAWAASPPWPPRNSTTALGLGACGCVILLHSRMQVRWLALIGSYSFSIFLFHSVFSAASRILLSRAFAPPFELLLASGILAGVTLPIVVELAVRRLGHPAGYWLLGQKPPPRRRGGGRLRETTAAMPL